MSDLTRLFKIGQKVKCNFDGKLHDGTVKETYTDHVKERYGAYIQSQGRYYN